MSLKLNSMITCIENFQIHVHVRPRFSPAPGAVEICQRIIIRSDSAFNASVAQTFKIRLNICIAFDMSVVKVQASIAPHSKIVGALNDDEGSSWASSFECLSVASLADYM